MKTLVYLLGHIVLLTSVALLAVQFEEDLADNIFSLATNSVPKDNAAFFGSPSVIRIDVAAEANFG